MLRLWGVRFRSRRTARSAIVIIQFLFFPKRVERRRVVGVPSLGTRGWSHHEQGRCHDGWVDGVGGSLMRMDGSLNAHVTVLQVRLIPLSVVAPLMTTAAHVRLLVVSDDESLGCCACVGRPS